MLFNSIGTGATETSTTSNSPPLILLVSGGIAREVGRTSMEQLHQFLVSDCENAISDGAVRIKLLANRPFFLSDNNYLKAQIEKYMPKETDTPVVLIGHSLGGHTTYRIARFQPTMTEYFNKAASIVLVTLDPTSLSWSGRISIAPNRWYNIYTRRFGVFSLIRWAHEPAAFRNRRTYLGHFRAEEMFRFAREPVMKHLGYPCSRR